jgi:hypothetical protein
MKFDIDDIMEGAFLLAVLIVVVLTLIVVFDHVSLVSRMFP